MPTRRVQGATYTYVTLAVPQMVYEEIERRLQAVGYAHVIDDIGGRCVIDMHGIALINEDEQ